jgi:uncharacterized protein YcbK (DUF882 family)
MFKFFKKKPKIQDLQRKNFKYGEFYYSKTAIEEGINNLPPEELLENGMKLADALQELRDALNIPLAITSGYRCKTLNTAIGGSPKSSHMQFLACDIISNITPEQLFNKIKSTGVKVHRVLLESNCVHFQINPDKKQYQNFFGFAKKIDGKWQVT